jgi:hypothetical protein
MTQAAPEKRFQLRDGLQPITFAGQQLAFASSQVDDNPMPRWTELAIYKTISGKYVLEKVGRSDVFHAEFCPRPGKGAMRYPSIMEALADVDPKAGESDLANFFVPCDSCKPSYDSEEGVVVEQDMHSVDAYESPEKLIEALYYRKNGAVRSLSNLSRNILDMAAQKDEGIAKVRSQPTDIT